MRTLAPLETSDAEYVRQTLCGNTQTFNCLIQKYQRQVYNLAYRMLGNAEDSGDIVQETFIRAYGALGSFRQDANFVTWLYKITSNLCIDQLRSRKNKGTLSLEVELEEGREPAANIRTSSPENVVIRENTRDIIHKAIMNLPEKYRAVVVMRHLHDMSVEEIATALELPSGTVKTHLFRAREMLRERLSSLMDTNADG